MKWRQSLVDHHGSVWTILMDQWRPSGVLRNPYEFFEILNSYWKPSGILSGPQEPSRGCWRLLKSTSTSEILKKWRPSRCCRLLGTLGGSRIFKGVSLHLQRSMESVGILRAPLGTSTIWSILRFHLKSDNLQYNMLGCWDDCLIDQASNVPNNFLSYFFAKFFAKILSIIDTWLIRQSTQWPSMIYWRLSDFCSKIFIDLFWCCLPFQLLLD